MKKKSQEEKWKEINWGIAKETNENKPKMNEQTNKTMKQFITVWLFFSKMMGSVCFGRFLVDATTEKRGL